VLGADFILPMRMTAIAGIAAISVARVANVATHVVIGIQLKGPVVIKCCRLPPRRLVALPAIALHLAMQTGGLPHE
jgi:hypothetical protein